MKSLIVTLILTGLSCLVHAQSFYLKFGGGYSFPLASYPIGSNSTYTYLRETDPETGFYIPASITTHIEVTGSYNSGMASTVAFGYTFSSNMSLEINMGYVHGRKYTVTSDNMDVLDDVVEKASKNSTEYHSRNAYIAPSFVLTTDERTLRPYVSAGVVLAIVTVNEKNDRRSDYNFDSGTSSREEKYSGGLSVGLRGAAGVDLKLNQKLSLFSEVAFIGMSYYPRERETLKYEVNGENMLISMNEYSRKTKFVKSVHSDTRSNENPGDRPSEDIRFSFGMSSVTASAGLKLFL